MKIINGFEKFLDIELKIKNLLSDNFKVKKNMTTQKYSKKCCQ